MDWRPQCCIFSLPLPLHVDIQQAQLHQNLHWKCMLVKLKIFQKKRFISYVVHHPDIACVQINPLSETPYIIGIRAGATILDVLLADGRPVKHIPIYVTQKKTQKKVRNFKTAMFLPNTNPKM